MANLYTLSNTASGCYQATFAGSSPLTHAAPTDPTDGCPTSGTRVISVYVSTGTGVTFSGAGSLLCHIYVPILGRWARVPGQDIALATSGERDLGVAAPLTARYRSAGLGGGEMLAYVPSGVTFSAGSAGIVITLEPENIRNSDIGA